MVQARSLRTQLEDEGEEVMNKTYRERVYECQYINDAPCPLVLDIVQEAEDEIVALKREALNWKLLYQDVIDGVSQR